MKTMRPLQVSTKYQHWLSCEEFLETTQDHVQEIADQVSHFSHSIVNTILNMQQNNFQVQLELENISRLTRLLIECSNESVADEYFLDSQLHTLKRQLAASRSRIQALEKEV
jgi:vacuolar-type H+-ATPase subunit D/Vma8